MKLDGDITWTIDQKTAAERVYDVVIVGSGVAGSIIAGELSKKKMRVLVVEAGLSKAITQDGYDQRRDRRRVHVSVWRDGGHSGGRRLE